MCSIADEMENEGLVNPTCDEDNPMDQDCYLDVFLDDLSGRQLDPAKVRDAREEEIAYINKMQVWDVVPRPAPTSGIKVLKGRWIDINKGTEERPNYRSRYVVKEI